MIRRMTVRGLEGLELDLDFTRGRCMVLPGHRDLLSKLHEAVSGTVAPGTFFFCEDVGTEPASSVLVGASLSPSEVDELHSYWVEALRSRHPRASFLLAAWEKLWGHGCGLGTACNPDRLLSLQEDPDPPPDRLLGLREQGSGYNAAFELLGNLARMEKRPDLILVYRPDNCLHPLIANRVLASLCALEPQAQVVAATSNPYVIESVPPVCRIRVS